MATYSYRVLTENESVESANIDKVDSVKNKWKAQWLSERVVVKYKGKERSQLIGDSIAKIDVPGEARKDKLYSPVNRNLCKNMRGARGKRKIEQEAEQDRIEKERVAMSLKKQKLVSKQKAKAKLAEAEKTARIAHWRAVRSRNNARLQALSEALSLKEKPKDSAATGTPWRSTRFVPHAAVPVDGRSRRPSHIALARKSWSRNVASSSKKKLQTPTPSTSAVVTASRRETVPPVTANGVSPGFCIPKVASSSAMKVVQTPTNKRSSSVPVSEANVVPAPAKKRQVFAHTQHTTIDGRDQSKTDM